MGGSWNLVHSLSSRYFYCTETAPLPISSHLGIINHFELDKAFTLKNKFLSLFILSWNVENKSTSNIHSRSGIISRNPYLCALSYSYPVLWLFWVRRTRDISYIKKWYAWNVVIVTSTILEWITNIIGRHSGAKLQSKCFNL